MLPAEAALGRSDRRGVQPETHVARQAEAARVGQPLPVADQQVRAGRQALDGLDDGRGLAEAQQTGDVGELARADRPGLRSTASVRASHRTATATIRRPPSRTRSRSRRRSERGRRAARRGPARPASAEGRSPGRARFPRVMQHGRIVSPPAGNDKRRIKGERQ